MALRNAGRGIQSICGGRGMCGTCRVAIDPDWIGRLPAPAPSESRLLNVLKAGQPNHRLACQTNLASQHDGLRFTLDPPPSRSISQEIKT
jgi:ferredoxin